MGESIVTLIISLIETTSVVLVFAYVVSRTRFFTETLDKRKSVKNSIVLIVLFGALSIFGTYGGIRLPQDAIANIRDLGAMMAGLVAGPIVGLGAGLIGGLHRYFLGGFVCVPCSIATVVAGLVGGLIYLLKRGEFVNVWQAALFAVLQESFHMGLTLAVARPFDQALAVVTQVYVPMMVANGLGAAAFAFIVRNLIIERRTHAEKERYRREVERNEFEMETARKIQVSLLPETAPRIPGFDLAALNIPARQVSGDFYDFIPVSDSETGIVIADVSGKGMSAALFMSLSRALVRANVHEIVGAAKAMQKANRGIAEESKFGMFVTLFYAVLDSQNKTLQYVNAGHNPPLLLKSGSTEIALLKAAGIALGVLDDVELEQREVKLAENDVVVLYTDGVTEAFNPKGEQFSAERLQKLVADNAALSAHQLAEKIEKEVTAFAAGQPQSDDITLVVVKAEGGQRSD